MPPSAILELEDIDIDSIEAGVFFEVLYDDYFYVDFIEERTYLNNNIYIDPQSNQKDEGKEKSFWHLTSKKQRYRKKVGKHYVTHEERLPDYPRAQRLAWVKQIIEWHTCPKIKIFYHRETTDKRPIRLYLWHEIENFVVILQKLGKSSSFLVTSFYISDEKKHKVYQERYERYINRQEPDLHGCEWF